MSIQALAATERGISSRIGKEQQGAAGSKQCQCKQQRSCKQQEHHEANVTVEVNRCRSRPAQATDAPRCNHVSRDMCVSHVIQASHVTPNCTHSASTTQHATASPFPFPHTHLRSDAAATRPVTCDMLHACDM